MKAAESWADKACDCALWGIGFTAAAAFLLIAGVRSWTLTAQFSMTPNCGNNEHVTQAMDNALWYTPATLVLLVASAVVNGFACAATRNVVDNLNWAMAKIQPAVPVAPPKL